MSSSLTLALQSARSGLLANQLALDVIANNVSNVNTTGYSRKVVNLQQRVLNGRGAGVEMADLSRRVDQGLLTSFRREVGALHSVSVQASFHARIQDAFGTPADNTSLSHIINDFQAALQSLALEPHSPLQQNEVIRWGEEAAKSIRHVSSTIQDLRLEADQRISQGIDEINGLLQQVYDFNQQIARSHATGQISADLQDQRDVVLDRLAELIDIRVYVRSTGEATVFTAGGSTLVGTNVTKLTHHAAVSMDATTTYASGGFGEILLGEGDNATDITGALGAGELAGLVELRDRTLPNLHGTLDQLAADLRDSINRLHNRGVAFPGLQTVTGSRVFAQPSNQTISLGGGSDVAIVLFNSDGSQAAATTLETIMQSAAYGSGAQPAHGPWSIAEVTATVEDWLQANGAAAASVGVSSDGHVQINLASSSMHLAFRDQSGSAPGDAASDALILFDADGDGASDESVSGFSFFFGLNDFFTDQGNADLFQSAILSESFAASSATLTFHGPSGALGLAVVVSPGDSLEDIATLINQNVPQLTASVVPEDGGYRLRIKSGDGASFTVTEDVAGGNALIGALGLKLADTGVATGLTVHPDIAASPSLMARGVVHWDANQGAAGEYLVGAGDNTLVHELVSVLATEAQFSKSGALGAMTTTLDGFAAALIGESAGLAESNQIQVDYRQGFADALKQKSDTLRGVNLDEEMGEMIVYQQAYAAAARIITTIQDMFDVLEQAFA